MKSTASRVLIVLMVFVPAAASVAAPVAPVPFRVPAKMEDIAEMPLPGDVRIEGWIGVRIARNAKNRLLVVDTKPLLAGFHTKPGSHPWIGEHIGKWLHAATLAWANTGDAALKAKLDATAAELISCQEPDGYLGTYVPEKRFSLAKGAEWDVWSHRYNMIGLVTYYQYTGNVAALDCCRKMGDLLIRTFPAQRSILATGVSQGMEGTCVLEPVVLLYRFTGDERYLQFARYLVKEMDHAPHPRVLTGTLDTKDVSKVSNAKAYQMLSNFLGLCELARATGDRDLLKPVLVAWEDIVANRLYITGSASCYELFRGDHDLPNPVSYDIGECCVTTTWIQLNWQLLRLTGEAKYGNEIERAVYNHLAGAQHPRGDDWCYYTALEGRKPYDKGITCCHSSGPRAMALVPLTAYWRMRGKGKNTLAVSTLETSCATLELGGQSVTVRQQSGFPRQGRSELTLRMKQPSRFAVCVRVPGWTKQFSVTAGGEVAKTTTGWATLPLRQWKDGDRIAIDFDLTPRLIVGTYGNTRKASLAWGPFVMAYDESLNRGLPVPAALGLTEASPPFELIGEKNDLVFTTRLSTRKPGEIVTARFTTFADAGATGSRYRVWLRAPGVTAAQVDSLLTGGRQSCSRQGNLTGSINDGQPDTIATTNDGRLAREDWFAVTVAAPVSLKRIVFIHGKRFPDGGWFDTSAGKPRIEVQREPGGPWATVGRLSSYPATTATSPGPMGGYLLKPGREFAMSLKSPIQAVAVRIVGTPASGNRPHQAFVSCAELQAFGETSATVTKSR